MKAQLERLTYKVELRPSEKLSLPEAMIQSVGQGRWTITVQPTDDIDEPVRDHSAFLGSYSPDDEGLYDDCQSR